MGTRFDRFCCRLVGHRHVRSICADCGHVAPLTVTISVDVSAFMRAARRVAAALADLGVSAAQAQRAIARARAVRAHDEYERDLARLRQIVEGP